MSTNKLIIERKINLINKDLKKLSEISQFSIEKYISSYESEAMTERYLERIIGRMIDINYHILTEEHQESPLDYYSSFIDMGKKEYLPIALAENLANAAGLRNRLAHEYDEIDEKKVYHAMQSCLKDVPLYLQHIINFLEKDSKQKKLV